MGARASKPLKRVDDFRLVLYESDGLFRSFYPLSLTRPVCHLRLGAGTIGARIARAIDIAPELVLAHPMFEWEDICPPVEDGAQTEPSGGPPFPVPGPGKKSARLLTGGRLSYATIFLSSGFIPEKGAIGGDLPADKGLFFKDESGRLVGYYLPPGGGVFDGDALRNPSEKGIASRTGLDFKRVKVGGKRFDFLWEIIEANPAELCRDIDEIVSKMADTERGEVHPLAARIGEGHIVVSEGAVVEPFALLDCSAGPICLGPDVLVKAHSRIEGPAFIGEGTHVYGAQVRNGCSIGNHCRIGGEIGQSILHGFVNKYHDGFLGHSYVGAWVNFGAGSTNSDLKNNYRPVRVVHPDGEVETGLTKVGAFIGDHVKTGIGTLMGTGFVCGAGSNLFGGNGVFPKWIPSFAWGDGRTMEAYRFKDFEEAARVILERRGVEMTVRYRRLLRRVFDMTAGERNAFAGDRSSGRKTDGGTRSPGRGRRRTTRGRTIS